MELTIYILSGIAALIVAAVVVAVSAALGRAFGGRWLLIFLAVMAVVAALLWMSANNSREHLAGLAEAIFAIFIWAPVLVCGTIGAAIGWGKRARKMGPIDAPIDAD